MIVRLPHRLQSTALHHLTLARAEMIKAYGFLASLARQTQRSQESWGSGAVDHDLIRQYVETHTKEAAELEGRIEQLRAKISRETVGDRVT